MKRRRINSQSISFLRDLLAPDGKPASLASDAGEEIAVVLTPEHYHLLLRSLGLIESAPTLRQQELVRSNYLFQLGEEGAILSEEEVERLLS